MEFKLRLVGERPTDGDLILEAETPLEGLKFVEAVGASLRRSIDHVGRYRHITLGALATYEMNVPQQMAIDSGLFDEKTAITIILENNLLSHYIFYSAGIHHAATRRPCYPYMTNEATLTSYIDELRFLEDWAGTGYARHVVMVGDIMRAYGATDTPDADDDDDLNFDESKCEGCHHACHHEQHPERPELPPPMPPHPKPGTGGVPEHYYKPQRRPASQFDNTLKWDPRYGYLYPPPPEPHHHYQQPGEYYPDGCQVPHITMPPKLPHSDIPKDGRYPIDSEHMPECPEDSIPHGNIPFMC